MLDDVAIALQSSLYLADRAKVTINHQEEITSIGFQSVQKWMTLNVRERSNCMQSQITKIGNRMKRNVRLMLVLLKYLDVLKSGCNGMSQIYRLTFWVVREINRVAHIRKSDQYQDYRTLSCRLICTVAQQS